MRAKIGVTGPTDKGGFTRTKGWRLFKLIYWTAAPVLALWFQSTRNFGYWPPGSGNPVDLAILNQGAATNAKMQLAGLCIATVALFFAIRIATGYVIGPAKGFGPPPEGQ
jgi:hypothetical protein